MSVISLDEPAEISTEIASRPMTAPDAPKEDDVKDVMSRTS